MNNEAYPSAIRDIAITALSNQTITGTHLQTTLRESDDPLSPLIGSKFCVDGAFTVKNDYAPTGSAQTRTAGSGGVIQRLYRHRLKIELSVYIGACPNWSADLLIWSQRVITLLNAAFEPNSGTNYVCQGGAPMGDPVRSTDGAFLIVGVLYTVDAFWPR